MQSSLVYFWTILSVFCTALVAELPHSSVPIFAYIGTMGSAKQCQIINEINGASVSVQFFRRSLIWWESGSLLLIPADRKILCLVDLRAWRSHKQLLCFSSLLCTPVNGLEGGDVTTTAVTLLKLSVPWVWWECFCPCLLPALPFFLKEDIYFLSCIYPTFQPRLVPKATCIWM